MIRTVLLGLAICACVMQAGCATGQAGPLIEEGLAELRLGRLEAAAEKLGEALGREPFNTDALYHMGRICHARRQFGLAIHYYSCCLELAPGYPLAREHLAKARQRVPLTVPTPASAPADEHAPTSVPASPTSSPATAPADAP